MSNLKTKVNFDVQRSMNSASFSGSYQALGTPLAHPAQFLLFVNNSGVIVTVSDDGTNDKFTVLPGSAVTFDLVSDGVTTTAFSIPAQTQFYVKASASTGLFYFSLIYAS